MFFVPIFALLLFLLMVKLFQLNDFCCKAAYIAVIACYKRGSAFRERAAFSIAPPAERVPARGVFIIGKSVYSRFLNRILKRTAQIPAQCVSV